MSLDGLTPRQRPNAPRPEHPPAPQPEADELPEPTVEDSPPPRGNGKMKWVIIVSIIVAIIAIVAAGVGARAVYGRNLQPVGTGEETFVRIENGMSSSGAAALLAEKNIIRSPWAFRLHLRLNGTSGDIQAGVYQLNPHDSAPQIADTITNGETITNAVTITSGTRLADVIKDITQLGYSKTEVKTALQQVYNYDILADKPAYASLEGYLFPDTYHISPDSSVGELIDLMLSNMDTKVTPLIEGGWRQQGLNTFEAVTLASIVQKEVSDPADQKRVAQVFLKRLAMDMPLEADPTFKYAAFQKGVEPTTGVDSPYNTYQHKGLPPGPISNVGISALKAVADPANTDYLYFVSAPDGTTYFSKTKDQHEANIDQYLR